MANRVQALVLGLGKAKQTNITTASASFLRFVKNNMDLTSVGLDFEDDAAEIGKGHEFASNIFPVSYTPANKIDKYCSAEFLTYCLAYGLGNVAEVAGVYTITPIDPGTTLELPYFTEVEQVPEGGGSAIDNAFLGCALNDFALALNYGPGRRSANLSCGWIGSGKITSPSTVTVPTVTAEHYLLGASLALSIVGVDYVAAKTILSCNLSWNNNLLEKAGFFPGSGLQDGASIRGRLEIGPRAISFDFTARLLASSLELTKLKAGTTGTAILTLTFDSTHTATITLQKVAYRSIGYVDADGLVAVKGTMSGLYDPTNGVISATAKCGVTGIAQ